jgi:hypothetical protein
MRALLLALCAAHVRLKGSGGAPVAPSRKAGRALLQQHTTVQAAERSTSAVVATEHSTVTQHTSAHVGAGESQRSTLTTGLKQPIFVPTIGIGNVTTPTMLPPPPPVLNPVEDYQPLDTAIGDYVLKQFVEPPTVTPPPLQSQLDLANGCPLFANGGGPNIMFVSAPNGCTSGVGRSGRWHTAQDDTLMEWSEAKYSLTGVAASFMQGQDSFGSIKQEFQLSGSKVDIIDCGLNVLYTMTETVFLDSGTKDQYTCDTYGICDGSIFLKYTIEKTGAPGTGAFSAMVPIFAKEFTLYDTASQNPVMAAKKSPSAWTAREPACPDYTKEWSLEFMTGNGHLAEPGLRWVLGFAVTAMSIRDEDRSNNGKVHFNPTEAMTWALLAIAIFGGGVLVYGLLWAFDKWFRDDVTLFCLKIETSFFPTTMYKNKYYS